jgi:cell division protein FtsZ
MPQIEDLPAVVQNQVRAHQGQIAAPPPASETRRRSLLEKLAAFGISRQEDAAPPPLSRPASSPAPMKPSSAALHAEYGRPSPRPGLPRPVQGQLDPHGRVAPRSAAVEDDQLEIPAFLRRQAGP